MELIKEYSVLIEAIIGFLILVVLFLNSDRIIKGLNLKMTKTQFLLLMIALEHLIGIIIHRLW
ncbi:hypothetical protein ATO12_19375 [Aquimarina atlantica]|uniref:Uncharacterized protein n=1 Tax=Aquimarina atlantica TaxID=1317122 RepID=A0A023BTA5_9FLAO|nr:hypothetical protein [Aquimarina atlantica]EZH73169.1 hypothetical protein ATO12_19375 [Aquimarina atlantica]